MKVLEKGQPVKSWSKKVTCTGNGNGGGGCRAKLLVEKDDLFSTYRSIMGRDEEWNITFECPECHVLTDIEAPFDPDRDLPTQLGWKRKQNKAQG